jgi:endonuclease YncB( thermonuclease family)
VRQPYVYRVTDIVKVTDGDTAWLRLDPGFRQSILVNVRLLGYDTPERNRGSVYEKQQAQAARAFTVGFLATERTLWIRTEKDPDDFGRWLGDIWYEDSTGEHHLGPALEQIQLATPWPTRWRTVYDQA